MKKRSDYLIIIPAYNEADTIEEVIERSKGAGDICVVNDCSTDATPEIVGRVDNIVVINHNINTHICRAILDGMQFAVDNDYEYAIVMDAGLSHLPEEIVSFKAHEQADLVVGTRKKKVNTPFYRRLVSMVGNFIYNISLDFPRSLFKATYYPDISSGFRRYSSKAMKHLLAHKMHSRSFDFQFESVMYLYRGGLTISEVPISYEFSNSSFNWRVMKDAIMISLKAMLRIY